MTNQARSVSTPDETSDFLALFILFHLASENSRNSPLSAISLYRIKYHITVLECNLEMSEFLSERFLEKQATTDQRWQALQRNIQAYYLRKAQASSDGHTGALAGLVWTSNRLCVSSESSLEDEHVIGEILSWYRNQRPLQGAMWWYLNPLPPSKLLEARLMARGVSPGDTPHFMWCELRKLHEPTLPCSGITVRLATAEDYLASGVENDQMYQTLSKLCPRRVFHFVACRGTTRLGRCIVNITTGDLGIGVLFDMMVAPSERKQGIGAALLQAACEMARRMGCNHIMLNATEIGERLYRRLGFQSIGNGRIWILTSLLLSEAPPTAQKVEFLEAVGLGNVETLTRLRESLSHDQLQEATHNHLTPFEIAARCHQRASATWLLGQGVIPDIISFWDLGWKDQIPTLITQHPELVNRESGHRLVTPLHVAIERNDIELAKLLLTFPNDFDAKDAGRSTPVECAHRLQRIEMLALLDKHTDINARVDVRAILVSILGKEQIRNDLVSTKPEA